MPKENLSKLIDENLQKVDNEQVREFLVSYIMEGYMTDQVMADWEQIRFVKQRVDELWKTLKHLSEFVLVKEKVAGMVKNFPKPSDILAHRRAARAKRK